MSRPTTLTGPGRADRRTRVSNGGATSDVSPASITPMVSHDDTACVRHPGSSRRCRLARWRQRIRRCPGLPGCTRSSPSCVRLASDQSASSSSMARGRGKNSRVPRATLAGRHEANLPASVSVSPTNRPVPGPLFLFSGGRIASSVNESGCYRAVGERGRQHVREADLGLDAGAETRVNRRQQAARDSDTATVSRIGRAAASRTSSGCQRASQTMKFLNRRGSRTWWQVRDRGLGRVATAGAAGSSDTAINLIKTQAGQLGY
jgi:hypothetical protein